MCVAGVIAFSSAKGNKQDSWRYRISVEIMTREGLKTGRSVWETYHEETPVSKIHNLKEQFYRGEAVAVDLGDRGTLFALMRGANGRAWLQQVLLWTIPFQEEKPGSISESQRNYIDYYSNLAGVKKDLIPAHYPMLVHFRDINDPNTIESVYERKSGSFNDMKEIKIDRLEEVFGSDVKINSISIEMTHDPIDWNLEDYLPWISSIDKDELRQKMRHIHVTNWLRYEDFRQGHKL